MIHSRVLVLLMSVTASTAMKFADSEQGAAFDKCIKIEDFNTKTLDDDVEVVDRVDGCCPDGTTPGAKYYNSYQGAQVVCGFKSDGTVKISTGSSNGKKTCTYNSCYVQKQGLDCKDDTKQLLNGCCGAVKGKRTFKDGCKNYDYVLKTVYGNSFEYCLSYDKDYGSKGWVGTKEKTDDQADGKLAVDKLYTYHPCSGGTSGGSSGLVATAVAKTSGSTTATTAAPATSSASQAAVGVLSFLGALMMTN